MSSKVVTYEEDWENIDKFSVEMEIKSETIYDDSDWTEIVNNNNNNNNNNTDNTDNTDDENIIIIDFTDEIDSTYEIDYTDQIKF